MTDKKGQFLTSDDAAKYLKSRITANSPENSAVMPFILSHFEVIENKICFKVSDLDKFIENKIYE